jgi:hypothetical protein
MKILKKITFWDISPKKFGSAYAQCHRNIRAKFPNLPDFSCEQGIIWIKSLGTFLETYYPAHEILKTSAKSAMNNNVSLQRRKN